MTLEEIFKDEPALLENPTVKKLIAYCQAEHVRDYEAHQKLLAFESNVVSAFIRSEVFVIGGIPAGEALRMIGEICNQD